MDLTPEERSRLDEMQQRPPLKDPYEVDGFRGLFGSKREVSNERKLMAKARARWRALDSETKDWLRWQLAVRVLETISACSNERVAGAIANLSEDDLSQLRVEIALGYQFVDNPSTEELPEILASGLTENPLDPPALLEACEEALMLPPHGLEELPNLRAVVRELYGIWRRDQLPGTPKVAAEAVVAIGDEIARRYRLPVDDARRRVRVNLRELDYRDQLPLR